MDMLINNHANFSKDGEQLSAVRVATLRARPSKEVLSWVVVLANE